MFPPPVFLTSGSFEDEISEIAGHFVNFVHLNGEKCVTVSYIP